MDCQTEDDNKIIKDRLNKDNDLNKTNKNELDLVKIKTERGNLCLFTLNKNNFSQELKDLLLKDTSIQTNDNNEDNIKKEDNNKHKIKYPKSKKK